MNKEKYNQNEVELLRARIANTKRSVEQAEVELENAQTEDEKVIWQNRLEQRKQEVAKHPEELDALERQEIAA
jgi:hypothetical protein